MKKLISFVLCAALIFALAVPVFAAGEAETDKEAEAVITGWYDAMGRHEWDRMLEYTHSKVKDDFKKVIDSTDLQEGVHNITSAKVLKVYELVVDEAQEHYDAYKMSFELELYHEIKDAKVFLVAVDMDVKKEDSFNRNGLVYHVVGLAKENGQWKLADSRGMVTNYLKDLIPAEDYSIDAAKITEIYDLRMGHGLIANLDGKIIDVLWTTGENGNSEFKNFESAKGPAYVPGSFTDVDESAWYGSNAQAVIARASEYGFVSGKGGGVFDPDGSLTVAEAIKLACVINSIYNGGTGKFEQGTPWYQVYVDYAVEKGIIEKEDFAGAYDRAATRGEMAYIFSRAVPDKGLPQINDIKVPDVTANTAYSANILKLYNAGILRGGNDGKFFPENSITRAEAAALAVRLAVPTERTYVFKAA